MASTSSSSIQKSFKYDVFLSFRGEDTRKTFVDHLYHALHQKGITTYKDDERIEKGERISDQLLRSIEDSRFYIVIFSKNYASSTWCLDELVKIMECQMTVEQTTYPIFYDVEPTEVRNQCGAIGEAFAKHVEKEAARRWRDALKEAADLAGWELKNTTDGHEAKFIQKVVKDISQKLQFMNTSIDGKLVGMEARVKNVVLSLDIGIHDVRMIGIKGIGGGGKTTLARAVFDHISISFEGKSFVENVREVSKGSFSGLKELQRQVLSDVLNDQDIVVTGVYEGKNMMKKMLPSRKVIVVLDDVDDVDQLEALAGELTWFKPGSRIIITTRDEQVLKAHQVNVIHDVNLLSHDEALLLFSKHAFGREIPNKGYEELSGKIVQYAAGLPLTVKVLGSHLCGRSECEWVDAIERLKIIPLRETLEKLELSYNGLENDQKEIFLDVACMLKGEEKEKAIKILESCGFRAQIGLRVLEQKSLISISENDQLLMHDHIEEMGMNIVRRLHPDDPSTHSRLWIKEEIEDILVNESGTEAIRSIKLKKTNLPTSIIMNGLRSMRKLIFLYVESGYGEYKPDVISPYLPHALRYIYWENYKLLCLPKTFLASNVVYLEMVASDISQLWEGGDKKVLSKLRFLDLSVSSLETIDLGMTPNLEWLNLGGCYAFEELYMPVECPKLQVLDLSGSQVTDFNLGRTPNLKMLYLQKCKQFEEIHMPVQCLNLEFVNLSHTKVTNFNLGMTPNLVTLYLEGCKEMEELHMPIECPNLQLLYLNGSEVTNLNLGMTPHLEMLFLTGCNEFVELHMPVECPKLKFLHLSGSKVSNLNLALAPHLESLDLKECYRLQEIHAPVGCLNNLGYLDLSGSRRFECFLFDKWMKLRRLSYLATLELTAESVYFCPLHPNNNLPKFRFKCQYDEPLPPPSGNLEKLLSFGLCACTNLESFSASICGLQDLRVLKLEGSISEVPKDLWQLESLKELSLSMKEIKHLPNSICMLKKLTNLELKSCLLLEQLPKDLGRLECLETLHLTDCVSLRDIPDSICNMKCLEYLRLPNCIRVEKLPEELGRLESLKELNIEGAGIGDLPHSIFQLKGLCIVWSRLRLLGYGFTSLKKISSHTSSGYI